MASIFPVSPLINFRRCTPYKPKVVKACKFVIKSVTGTTKVPVPVPAETIVRRSGNYKPCMWDDNFLQSLTTEYRGEAVEARASELKEEVRMIFSNVVEPLDQLELIDQLQRVGLDYHFHDEIKHALNNIHNGLNIETWEKDLHATAVEFRLLRQHGYYISPEGFKRFMENGSFNKGICADVQGLLSLYEASYFSIEGESIIEEAWSVTSKLLRKCLENIIDLDLQAQVRHALELPQQWSVPIFDARWYINLYQKSGDMVPAVLEFAKLDFNIRQALNQEELKDLSRWWSRLDMGEKLPFARDRLVASFFWSLGISGKPQHRYCREVLTKIIELIGVCDDVYDIYGTLDELELFTNVIARFDPLYKSLTPCSSKKIRKQVIIVILIIWEFRWDIYAMKDLPEYMQLCFQSLYNFVNETSKKILNDQNINMLPHQRKWFNDLFKCHLVEARWYHSGYQPTLEEYLNNGLVSIAGPIGVLYSYICTEDQIKKEELKFIEDLPDIVRLPCEILRLTDDYGTSSVVNIITCTFKIQLLDTILLLVSIQKIAEFSSLYAVNIIHLVYVTQTRVRSVKHDTYPSVRHERSENWGHGDTVLFLDTGTGTHHDILINKYGK